jgi:hypothetical protein
MNEMELLPCPFCGGVPQLQMFLGSVLGVVCLTDGCPMTKTAWRPEQWNVRTAAEPQPAIVAPILTSSPSGSLGAQTGNSNALTKEYSHAYTLMKGMFLAANAALRMYDSKAADRMESMKELTMKDCLDRIESLKETK